MSPRIRFPRRFVEDRRASVEAASHDEVVLEDEKYSERLVEQAIEAMLHKRQLAARLLRPCALCGNGTRPSSRRVGPRTPS